MYCELHAHSNFSFLDGASRTEDLVERCASMGMPALAITDHNGLYSACLFSTKAREAGIKPILGAEVTLTGGYHLTLLTENAKGYANLSCLITKAQLSGTKGNPVLPYSALEGHTEGIICLSGCKKGEIAGLLIKDEKDKALFVAEQCISLFGKSSFYIEIQSHLTPEDKGLTALLINLARHLGLRTVATNNVHYATRDDHVLHDVLLCIRNRTTIDCSAAFRKLNSEYYLKGYDEMLKLPWIPGEAILQSCEIADRCTFELNFSSVSYPEYPLPENITAAEYLREISITKARERYGDITEDIRKRLNHELTLIETKGLSGYFLIVRDIIEFAKKSGISAQGRGSAASSVVAYILDITPVDPLKHNLFVGRFLNELNTPDIDIDIATHRREEIIRYVYETYGIEHAAMVCTYVTFQARNAIREVGKVLGFPPHVLDRMAKAVSSYGGVEAIEALKDVPEFRSYLDSYAWRHFSTICSKIARFPRHLSIHVGGMIITPKPISEIVPLEHARAEGRIVCQWDKDSLDDAGLIKFDLLGLRMLSLIDEARQLIREHKGIEVDFEHLSPDDQEVYRLISEADTIGVFQVESRAQMQTLPKIKPCSIEDLTLEVAIVRPGPLQGNMVHPFIRRRQGKEQVVHLHPKLAPILGETLGVILFQEQILQVAMEIAGFTAGEANLLRKTMGRKNAREELVKWHTRFVDGAKKQGINENISGKIFNHINNFADFGFCKSHAASFAILCYRSAWLKRYYPAEFYCALLNNQPMGFYDPEVIINDAMRHNVAILPLDINKSLWRCSLEEGSLRIGFRYVKAIGKEKGSRILTAREINHFISIQDFLGRTQMDRESLQNLIAVGAFDKICRSRRKLIWEAGIIGKVELPGVDLVEKEYLPIPEMGAIEEMIIDYTYQGFSASHHIMHLYRKALDLLKAAKSKDLVKYRSGDLVRIGGYRVCLQMPPTAKGFAFITLEDEEGLINVVLTPDCYWTNRILIRTEPLLLVEGVVENRDNIINVMAKTFTRLS